MIAKGDQWSPQEAIQEKLPIKEIQPPATPMTPSSPLNLYRLRSPELLRRTYRKMNVMKSLRVNAFNAEELTPLLKPQLVDSRNNKP